MSLSQRTSQWCRSGVVAEEQDARRRFPCPSLYRHRRPSRWRWWTRLRVACRRDVEGQLKRDLDERELAEDVAVDVEGHQMLQRMWRRLSCQQL